MQKLHVTLGIAAFCLATASALPAVADAGKTEALVPSGGSAPPLAEFTWLVSKNADKYDLQIFDKNGKQIQARSFTSAEAKCSQSKNKVCRAAFGEPLNPKAMSWRVRGVQGSKKGPFSDLAYFNVAQDGPLWAVVNPDATLARGAGVESVTPDGVGSYIVGFVQDVTLCAYTATVGFSGDTGVPPDGAATVVGAFEQPTAVYVTTYNQAGTATERGFHLLVTCAGGELPPEP